MKEKILEITNKYKNQPMTRINIDSLYLELKEFFKSQGLKELEFCLNTTGNEISLMGIKRIDMWAIIGIMK